MWSRGRLAAFGLCGAVGFAVYAAIAVAVSPAGLCGRDEFAALGLQHAWRTDDSAGGFPAEALAHQGLLAASDALAVSIRFSHARDIGVGQPIPPAVRRALAPYFPEQTLRRVRWTIAGPRLSLGTLWAHWYDYDGAVTLDNLIVFTSERASTRIWLWAHELTHVRQYEVLGLDEFARCYTSDATVLEELARRNADRIQLEHVHDFRLQRIIPT